MIREHYQALEHISAQTDDVITLSDPTRPVKLRADSPAFDAMTDLRRVHPVSITPNETLEEARSTMIVCGVKLLFVRNSNGGLIGLLTAADLAGERALLAAQNSGRTVPELTVEDVMTHVPDIEFLDFTDVARSEIGHIVSTLKNHGRQHALVVTKQDKGLQVIGLFSATQIARQMGVAMVAPVRANTFAEIEAVVASS